MKLRNATSCSPYIFKGSSISARGADLTTCPQVYSEPDFTFKSKTVKLKHNFEQLRHWRKRGISPPPFSI